MPDADRAATVRISVISFLNAAPLTYLLHYGPVPEWVQPSFHVPAQSADALRAGLTDAALVPAVEYQRISGLVVVPSIAIASPGPVRSVILAARVPLDRIREVGVTTDSRTSVALVRLILGHFLAHDCRYVPFDSAAEALARFDGVLIIGDGALTRDFTGFQVHDLAALWRRFTGLPAVFAVWAVRREASSARLIDFLLENKREGLKNRAAIAADFSRRLGLPEAELRSYLQDNLSFDLGSRERESLQLFYRLCHENGLLDGVRPLEYADVG